ncbi:conserved hypothetical protein [delta proteobacterium NaphS2]|nr:conserved hypothetical protein [delta proteobacterium NaphS2]
MLGKERLMVRRDDGRTLARNAFSKRIWLLGIVGVSLFCF